MLMLERLEMSLAGVPPSGREVGEGGRRLPILMAAREAGW